MDLFYEAKAAKCRHLLLNVSILIVFCFVFGSTAPSFGSDPDSTVMTVEPPKINIDANSGTTNFTVWISDGSIHEWTAEVTVGMDWLRKTESGNTISCSYDANKTSTSRTAQITVTARIGSIRPKTVTVTQSAGVTWGDENVYSRGHLNR